MNVALVYDRINKIGGAERVLLSLHELFPDAPLYTALYDTKKASWANVMLVKPSWMNSIPYANTHHELFPWLTPFAFESMDFDSFDLVISVTSAEAKYIITKPKTIHICYCLTPTRYLWSGFDVYIKGRGIPAFFLKLFAPMLQRWDLVASSRPDTYIAISNRVKKRIETYYHRPVEAVIYPPVRTDFFVPSSNARNDYYLLVSRLVGYKRPDIVIDAFNRNRYPLVVVGTGSEKQNLMDRAKGNIIFSPEAVTDKELRTYYQHCRALVFAGDEDFGIVAAEAQSSGKPVIAYQNSGIAEIIIDGKTGILFDKQTPSSLNAAIEKERTMSFDSATCRTQGQRFDQVRFKEEFQTFVKTVYNNSL
jgi:glycosyltransferase involved in cell wall biosynthesis